MERCYGGSPDKIHCEWINIFLFFFTILVLLRDFKSMPVKVTVGYEGACKRDIPRQHLSDGGVY